tara:strand:+ start:24943 stop:25350 length:408 start_codon:yes stop_codon:yes gene_type:complete
MWRRVRIYLIGVALGCLLVWAMLIRDRSDNTFDFWLPGERILTAIQEDSVLVFPPKLKCEYECYGYNSIDWEYFVKNADVDFSKSKTHQEPKIYFLSSDIERKGKLEIEIAFADSAKEIVSVKHIGEPEKTCNCE